MSSPHRDAVSQSPSAARSRRLFAAVVVYLSWLGATWLLETRVGLFTRYDPTGRTLYALLANVAIGTVVAGVAVHWLGAAAAVGEERALRSSVRWRSRPLVLLLTAVVGALMVIKAAPPAAGELFATFFAIVVADTAFALYHVAHSAPFDRPGMIAFLALPGFVTGILVFVVRDRAVAILAQNLFAMIGITQNADVEVFRHPFVWAYAVAAAATVAAVLALRPFERAKDAPWRPALRGPHPCAIRGRS